VGNQAFFGVTAFKERRQETTTVPEKRRKTSESHKGDREKTRMGTEKQ
jgi:hypothetical protein